ncbi:uncharacterized protein [Misgurnus anguillicaudatus]|uniref:uncharacterized protein n=1 Tax=Misgurnus anguillicaudatus TaxID=75329 RepID=UPI003CCF2B82
MAEEQGKDSASEICLLEKQSYQSKGEVGLPNFNEETLSTTESERPDKFSNVSVKSYRSKGEGPNFKEKTPSTTRSDLSKGEGPNFSEVPKSNVSLKSHRSKGEGPNFKEKTPSTTRSERPDKFSYVSLKSYQSKGEGPNFKEKTPSTTRSDLSKGEGPNFSEVPKRKQWPKGTVNIGAEITRWENLKRQKNMDDVQLANYLLNWVQHETPDSGLKTFKYSKDLSNIFQELEQKIIVFFKNELKKFKKIIKKENTKYFVKDFEEDRSKINEAALDITLYFLRQMKKDKVADDIQDELISIYQRPIKRNLRKRFQCVCEGIAKHGDSTSLNKIYTELYITEGEQVNAGHDMTQIQSDSKRSDIQEKSVNYTDVFKKTEEDKHIRTVLTKGVAGIGKSVSVQKFVLDWAEEKVNKDITFIFPLPFREINLQEKDKLSLMDLIIQYFPETKGLNFTRNDKFKILFIFDGLDECRLPLKFEDNEICRDVTMKVPLDVLLTNLFKGNLFPSALIWITSRPAAASKIPPECIDRVTEVRGFNDEQKQEYFRKKIPDTTLAEKIIKHVKESKSLFIMCHIPVFCWISATVLQNILEKTSNQPDDTLESPGGLDSDDTPQTLTQMYTHFFRFQILQSSRKYNGNYGPDISWEKGDISLLGNLAFQQLKRNNLIFYYSDLEESGINVSNATAYSGMFTQIFKEETGMRLETTFSFVHMSFQEFVAALYAHLFLDSDKTNVFAEKHTEQEGTNETMCGLLKTAVNKALESDTGHLDLFLRFLLGMSLNSNRQLLRGLLTQPDQNGEQTKTEIVMYIKRKLDENLSPERSINLFYCLHELNDQTLVKDIQDQLNKGSLSSVDLSPAQWSALAFVLVTSDVELEDFELQKFKKSDECLRRLEMVVKNSKRALLNDCNLTENSCFCLAKVFKSDNSLKELNMNNNSLQDSGVKELFTGLENIKCKLDILRLDKCDLTEESCSALASVLGSDSTSLKELDLSNNKLQDSGVKLLSDGLQNNSTLEILRLSNCSITEEGYKSLALKLNLSHLTELDLTGNDPGESGVKMLTDVQQHPDCTLKTLRFLKNPAETALKYLNDVLGENLLFKRELDLSKHELRKSGLKDLAAVLEDKHCKIKTLILNDKPYIREEDCAALASAFISNPSNLIKLDLSRIKLKDSGIKCFSTLFENLQCKLEKIKLNCVDITKEGCTLLASALNANPSHLRELDLTGNKIEDCGVTEISTLLKNSECRLEKLRLSNCSITEEGYKSLALALESNPSHLTELHLTGNDPGESGVKMLTDVQQHPDCTLKTLRFLKNTAETALKYLNDVLGENLLFKRELDLSKHELRKSGLKDLAAVLEDKHCKIKTLILNDKPYIREEDCAALASALISNPSNLIKLDLSRSKLKDSGIKCFSTLFENLQFKLEKLKLSNCSITEEGYKSLALALESNPSHLTELHLTGNDPGESGVKMLIDVQKKSNCTLKTLRLLKSPEAEKGCQYVMNVVHENPLLMTELKLTHIKLTDTEVMHLAALLEDKHCKLKTIQFDYNCISESGCADLLSAFNTNPSNLKELDLSGNQFGNAGIEEISTLLKNSLCRLEKLKFSKCSITEKGYRTLALALKSNPSHLTELNLTENDPGDSGVKMLIDAQKTNQGCKLQTIRFLKSPAAEEACKYLTEVLDQNPLLLTELDLSDNKLGDLDGNNLSALLMDSHSRLVKIRLNKCDLTEESCSALASVLGSDSTSLKELDLSNNKLQDSGVKLLSDGLQKNSTLEILRLSNCSITEGGYKSLALALKLNPSHLTELDLTGNDPGESGVKMLTDVQQHPDCTLKTLRFLKNPAETALKYLNDVLGENLLFKRELDLSKHELRESGLKDLAAVLEDKHCKIKTLILNDKPYIREEDCAALASAFISNPSNLIELDLSRSKLKDSGIKCFSTLFENLQCKLKKLKFNFVDITKEGCTLLASALNANPSHLRELDLIDNKIEDCGVTEISTLLKNSECRLEKLRLSNCSIAEEGYKSLALALEVNPSHLTELELTGNDPGESGVKMLIDVQKKSNYTLKKLRLLKSSEAENGCQYVMNVVHENPLLISELKLTRIKLTDTKVKHLAALLEDKHCKLKTIQFDYNCISESGCADLLSAFNTNPSNLKELDLSGNQVGNAGMEKVSTLLKHSLCRLEKLKFSNCGITEEGYETLALALKSNPSHLTELNLTANDPGDSGVKKLIDAQKTNQGCKLQTIRFLKSPAAEEACKYLTEVLDQNPLLLTELDLSDNKLGDLDGNNLSALLMDSHSRLVKIRLNHCDLTEKNCSALAAVLSSNTILKEIDLSDSCLPDSGVKQLCEELKMSKLKILKLNKCGLQEEGCSALATVLGSDSTSLKKLDLSNNNKLQDSGVKLLSHGLQNNSTLEILRLSNCSITEEGYKSLASALELNPSHLTELDLTGNDPGESGVKKLTTVQKKSNYTLKTLKFLSPDAEKGCEYVMNVVQENPLLLREVKLTKKYLNDIEVKHVAALLKDKHCKLKAIQ